MKTIMFLLGLLRGNVGWAVAGLALAVVTVLANIALMAISGRFLTGMAMAGAIGAAYNFFLPSAIIRGCAIVRTVGRYLERLVTHEATFRLIGALRPRVFLALAPYMPFGMTGLHSGDLAARLGSDLDSLQRAYLQILIPPAAAFLVGAAVVAYSAGVDGGVAALIAGGLLIGGAGLPGLLALAGRRPGRDSVAAANALRIWAVDRIDGLEELEAFAATPRHDKRLAGLHNRLATAQTWAARQDAFGAASAQVLGSLVLWGVVLVGTPSVAAGTLAAPDLVMLAFLALASIEVTGPLPSSFQAWGTLEAASDRVRPLLSAEVRPDSAGTSSLPTAAIPPHIRLESVSVRYPGAPTLALDGLTLDLPPNARVALVGASGSGKSTVAALLAGFLMVEHGRLLLNGRPATPDRIAPALAVAPQTPHLLAGSIRRNLCVAAPNAVDAELTDACGRAGLGPWLAALPDGIDTLIGAGGRPVSGGEARRLAVARALLGAGSILVLDEPGEGLDPTMERTMLDRLLSEEACKRTILLITHRPAGLDRMDHVVVLDRGKVLEQGPPWALASRAGPFRRFLERSFV